MSHIPSIYHRLSPSEYAALHDAVRVRAVQLRAEAIGTAAAWLSRQVAAALRPLSRRLRALAASRTASRRAHGADGLAHTV
ncbi:MAG TPA: hypothetical protein VHM00_04350 [Caldimonas sp.]|nr:hypothetical protein [Caldimonas sp.]HEX2540295.1 hypothetical protein [Caldimonas sp.]